LKESPRDVNSNRKLVLVSQATSFKGSDSHQMITEPDLPVNAGGAHGFHNLQLHPYEAQNQNHKSNAGNTEKIFTLYKPRRGSKEPSRGGISNGCVSPSSTALRVEANMFCES